MRRLTVTGVKLPGLRRAGDGVSAVVAILQAGTRAAAQAETEGTTMASQILKIKKTKTQLLCDWGIMYGYFTSTAGAALGQTSAAS